MTGLSDPDRIALTIDVEEWFHAPESPLCGDEPAWGSLSPTLPEGLERTLDLLDRLEVKATFFVLGWAARRYPEHLRRVVRAGHEVASHGWGHRRVDRMSPSEFKADLRAAKGALQECASCPVEGFRAPRWSMPAAAWPYEILAEEGFRYSSSRLAIPGLGMGTDDGAGRGAGVVEIPALRFPWAPLPAGGTVALRILPPRWLERARDARLGAGEHAVFWFHPWELVPEAPRVGGGPLFRWARYTGLSNLPGRIARLVPRGDRTLVRALSTAHPASRAEPPGGH